MSLSEPQKINKETFRQIFVDNWSDFKKQHPFYDNEHYEKVIQKMLSCGKSEGGYTEYLCMHCGHDSRRISFTCKSSFCLSCSKVYVDNFVAQVSKTLHPGVIYRHVILTIPSQLRVYFYEHRHDKSLFSSLMRCGYECLEDVVSVVKHYSIKLGVIVVLQTHGRSGRYNPHLHIIMTSGGINKSQSKWVDLSYFPYKIMHKKWQYSLLNMLKMLVPGIEMENQIDELWNKYPKGFVANIQKGTVPERCRGLAEYLAKYLASPPISIRRIIAYDGESVTYWYNDHTSKSRQIEKVDVFTFIGRMVQHIFPKGFQRVRYYGLQSTKMFSKWCTVISSGIKQIGRIVKGTYQIVFSKKYRERYKECSGKDPMICKHCGSEMDLFRIWHPKYGVIYDELENIKAGKYGVVV